jgi:hypothetical protein
MTWSTHRTDATDSVADSGVAFFHPEDLEPSFEFAHRGSLKRAVAPKQGEILYDGLPVWLRGFDLASPAVFYGSMVPTLLLADSSNSKSVAAGIDIVGPAGPPSQTSHGGLEVDVHYEGKVDKLWFHPGPGHILLVWDKADGTELSFKSQRRE